MKWFPVCNTYIDRLWMSSVNCLSTSWGEYRCHCPYCWLYEKTGVWSRYAKGSISMSVPQVQLGPYLWKLYNCHSLWDGGPGNIWHFVMWSRIAYRTPICWSSECKRMPERGRKRQLPSHCTHLTLRMSGWTVSYWCLCICNIGGPALGMHFAATVYTSTERSSCRFFCTCNNTVLIISCRCGVDLDVFYTLGPQFCLH